VSFQLSGVSIEANVGNGYPNDRVFRGLKFSDTFVHSPVTAG